MKSSPAAGNLDSPVIVTPTQIPPPWVEGGRGEGEVRSRFDNSNISCNTNKLSLLIELYLSTIPFPVATY